MRCGERHHKAARAFFNSGLGASALTTPTDTRISLTSLGAARADQLARITAAGLVSEGRVFLLSLDAIRSEMGARWQTRGEIVRETFERDLVRAMPAPDVFIRLDDTTILAAINSTDAYSGQTRCAQVLREALQFFLGRNQDSDLSISRVSALTPNGVSADRLDPMAGPPPRPSPRSLHETEVQPSPPERWTPPLSTRRDSFSFLAEREGVVSFDIGVKPVWRLDRNSVGAYAIRPLLPAPLSSFTDKDQEAIDACVADFVVPLLREYRSEGGVFAILCPFSFATLSARSPRERLIHRCAEVLDVMRRAVVLEIGGLTRGAPASRVTETLSMCRPMTRVATLSISDPSAMEILSYESGADGAALDAGAFSGRQLGTAITTARRRTTNLVVHNVSRTESIDRLRALGATHVTEGWPEMESVPDRFAAAS